MFKTIYWKCNKCKFPLHRDLVECPSCHESTRSRLFVFPPLLFTTTQEEWSILMEALINEKKQRSLESRGYGYTVVDTLETQEKKASLKYEDVEYLRQLIVRCVLVLFAAIISYRMFIIVSIFFKTITTALISLLATGL